MKFLELNWTIKNNRFYLNAQTDSCYVLEKVLQSAGFRSDLENGGMSTPLTFSALQNLNGLVKGKASVNRTNFNDLVKLCHYIEKEGKINFSEHYDSFIRALREQLMNRVSSFRQRQIMRMMYVYLAYYGDINPRWLCSIDRIRFQFEFITKMKFSKDFLKRFNHAIRETEKVKLHLR